MMYTWGWRIGALTVLSGVTLWGLYRSGLQNIEQSLTSLLGTDTSIAAMRLDANGRIRSLSHVELAGSDVSPCSLGSVRLHSAPWSMMQSRPHLERIVGQEMVLASSDSWSQELDSVVQTLGAIDPELKNPVGVDSVDIAVETDNAIVPLLASWRSEWQGVLASYQKQIVELDKELETVQQTSVDTSNPLRDRELIKSQMASIERLTQKFAQMETELLANKSSLVERAGALRNEGKGVLSQRIAQREKEIRERLKERMAKNLEALRGQLYAKLVSEVKQNQHIVSNLAHRGTRIIDGTYSVVSPRGKDMLNQFAAAPSLDVHCLEFSGLCGQASPVEFVSAFYPNRVSESGGGKFFVVCRDAKGAIINRFTGSISSIDQYQFDGTMRMESGTLATGLLTEPNFELCFDGAELDVQTTVTPGGRQLKLQWRAKNASLKTIVNDASQAVDLSRSPLDHKDCLAMISIPLDGDESTLSVAEKHDSFFDSWNLKIIEGCSDADVVKKNASGNDWSVIDRMIDQEFRQAMDAFVSQTTKIASTVSTMDLRHERLASEILPRQIRTANQSNSLQR